MRSLHWMGLAVSGGRGANGSRRCLYQGQAPTRRQNKTSSEIIFQDPCHYFVSFSCSASFYDKSGRIACITLYNTVLYMQSMIFRSCAKLLRLYFHEMTMGQCERGHSCSAPWALKSSNVPVSIDHHSIISQQRYASCPVTTRQS